jgi:prepilin peptidase CpaA
MPYSYAIQAIAAFAFAYAAAEDLRHFRIPNAVSIILALLFVVFSLFNGALGPALGHAFFAAVMFAALLGAFAMGWLGGGDVKLLTAAYLWTGLENAALFTVILSAAAAVYLVLGGGPLRILPCKTNAAGRMTIPYGFCIATAWIAVAALRINT